MCAARNVEPSTKRRRGDPVNLTGLNAALEAAAKDKALGYSVHATMDGWRVMLCGTFGPAGPVFGRLWFNPRDPKDRAPWDMNALSHQVGNGWRTPDVERELLALAAKARGGG
jgi:hypothetical protein